MFDEVIGKEIKAIRADKYGYAIGFVTNKGTYYYTFEDGSKQNIFMTGITVLHYLPFTLESVRIDVDDEYTTLDRPKESIYLVRESPIRSTRVVISFEDYSGVPKRLDEDDETEGLVVELHNGLEMEFVNREWESEQEKDKRRTIRETIIVR